MLRVIPSILNLFFHYVQKLISNYTISTARCVLVTYVSVQLSYLYGSLCSSFFEIFFPNLDKVQKYVLKVN